MLILPHSCFLHFPKTGGSWVKKAIAAAGINCEEYSVNGNPHIGLDHCPCPDKFKFAFVRHPVQLYRSYWQYKMGAVWDPEYTFDSDCRSDDFGQFVRNVVKMYPGIFGKTVVGFVGPVSNEIEFIGRYENLIEDLISALKQAGEIFDEGAVRNLPPYNVSDKVRFPAEYSPELEQLVRDAEEAAIRRFGYD